MPVPPSEISLQMSLHNITPLQALLCSVNRNPIKQDLDYRKVHDAPIAGANTPVSPSPVEDYY